ncbi:MAG: TenA family protein, partial [Candidatus Marinimicrobia bacterium]|nr:TenA family protein [Candidatus Neomarinimicrobiota bacterium]
MVLKHTGATASEVFTDSLWAEIEDIYQSILEHPFITELTRGELDLEIFKFYLQQDALYLEDFSRALAITGARAEEPKELQQFIEFAQGAIVTERALHESYFEQYDVDATGPKSPSCFNYTNFLIATASTGSYPESVAALLPCFWIYREVGNYIYKQAVDDNPYQDWIDTYS